MILFYGRMMAPGRRRGYGKLYARSRKNAWR